MFLNPSGYASSYFSPLFPLSVAVRTIYLENDLISLVSYFYVYLFESVIYPSIWFKT